MNSSYSKSLFVILFSVLLQLAEVDGAVDAYVGEYDVEYVRMKAVWKNKYFHENEQSALVQYTENGDIRDLASHWYLEESGIAGEYWIRNRVSGHALHAIEGGGAVRTGAVQPANAAFRWVFEPGRYFFRVRNAGFPDQYLSTQDEAGQTVQTAALVTEWDSQKIVLEAIPQGATLPWLSYDEDNFDSLTAPAHVARTSYDRNFDQYTTAAEAQKNACIVLNDFGTRVTWTVRESANAASIRYSVQDGVNGTITLTITPQEGGADRIIKVPLSSNQAWVYFQNGEEFNSDASGRLPAKRFAEARLLLDSPVLAGDTITLSRESGDELTWIDVVELETATAFVPADLSGYYVPTQAPWNAKGDGVANDYFAILNCLNDAAAAGKKVYLPAGRYKIPYELILPGGTVLQGAGMWHTELFFSGSGSQNSGGIRADGNNLHLSNLYIKGSQTTRSGGYKGIKGNWGTGSRIENVWIEDTETGMWIADYYGSLGVTDGLVVRNCRIRNTFADGINMAEGTRNTIVENCHFRSTGDDALASWASGRKQNLGATFNQKFRYNTIECGYRAGGIGIFGGGAHEIHHNVVRDQVVGAGIRLNTVFVWLDSSGPQGYPFNSTGDPIRVYDNTLIRTGARTLFNEGSAALDLATRDTDIENMWFRNIRIEQSQFIGIRFQGYSTSANPLPVFKNVTLENILVSEVPVGMRGTGIALGAVDVRDLLVEPPAVESVAKPGFQLNSSSTFGDWQLQHFGDTTAPAAAPDADPNLNGMANLFEFLFGTNPNDPGGTAPARLDTRIQQAGGQPFLELTFPVRAGGGIGNVATGYFIDGIPVSAVFSPDLSGEWQAGASQVTQAGSRIGLGDGTEAVTLRINEGFLRLQAEAR